MLHKFLWKQANLNIPNKKGVTPEWLMILCVFFICISLLTLLGLNKIGYLASLHNCIILLIGFLFQISFFSDKFEFHEKKAAEIIDKKNGKFKIYGNTFYFWLHSSESEQDPSRLQKLLRILYMTSFILLVYNYPCSFIFKFIALGVGFSRRVKHLYFLFLLSLTLIVSLLYLLYSEEHVQKFIFPLFFVFSIFLMGTILRKATLIGQNNKNVHFDKKLAKIFWLKFFMRTVVLAIPLFLFFNSRTPSKQLKYDRKKVAKIQVILQGNHRSRKVLSQKLKLLSSMSRSDLKHNIPLLSLKDLNDIKNNDPSLMDKIRPFLTKNQQSKLGTKLSSNTAGGGLSNLTLREGQTHIKNLLNQIERDGAGNTLNPKKPSKPKVGHNRQFSDVDLQKFFSNDAQEQSEHLLSPHKQMGKGSDLVNLKTRNLTYKNDQQNMAKIKELMKSLSDENVAALASQNPETYNKLMAILPDKRIAHVQEKLKSLETLSPDMQKDSLEKSINALNSLSEAKKEVNQNQNKQALSINLIIKKLKRILPFVFILFVFYFIFLRKQDSNDDTKKDHLSHILKSFSNKDHLNQHIIRGYHEFLMFCKNKGVQRSEQETPLSFASHVIRRFPNKTDSITKITEIFSRFYYGQKVLKDDPMELLNALKELKKEKI